MSHSSLPLLALSLSVLAAPSLADGRRPGSVLVYPIHRSELGFTIVSVTNTNTLPAGPETLGGSTNALFEYVNTVPNPLDSALPLGCSVVDRLETLTPADTLSVLTTCHNAASAEGYLVISATSLYTGLGKSPWSFNHLVGSELVVNALGGVYNLNAIPFVALEDEGELTDLNQDGQLDFNGVEYEGLPDELYGDFLAIAGSSLTLINLTGGPQFTAVAGFDLWNDNEQPLSTTKLFRCWFEESLLDVSPVFSESYLRNNTPHDPQELDVDCDGVGDFETGWMRIRGNVASSSAQSITNPAFLGAITAGTGLQRSGAVQGIDGGNLLWESVEKQLNGDFLEFGNTVPEDDLGPPETRLDTTPPGASSSFQVQVCCDGPNVYAVWRDTRNQVNGEIFFNRSTDGGETWLPQDLPIGSGPTPVSDPLLCCEGENLYLVWSNGPRIRFSRSIDGGDTWTSPVDLDTGAGAAFTFSTFPALCCDGERIYVAWVDHRNGTTDIYANASEDGGLTWLATDVRLDTDAGAADSDQVQLTCEGDDVYAVWVDRRNGEADVYLNRSLDGGASWLASDIRLDTNAAGSTLSSAPAICARSGRVVVMWRDSRTAPPSMRVNRSLDNGLNWLADDVEVGPGVGDPKLCCDGSTVYAAYTVPVSPFNDIAFNRTTDHGETWLPVAVRLDTDEPGAATSRGPAICCDGSELVVAWEDSRDDGIPSIRANRSADGGDTWLADDLLVSGGPGRSVNPQICCGGGAAHILWEDNRDGEFDIYAAKLEPAVE